LAFAECHSDSLDSLLTQLKKSRDVPTSGKPLHDIANPKLRGRLRRIWVGRSGFRYVYFYDSKKSIVLPVFISMTPRAKFDWTSAPFEEIADRIVADLQAGREDHFKYFQLP
jgi:hypothetical protein